MCFILDGEADECTAIFNYIMNKMSNIIFQTEHLWFMSNYMALLFGKQFRDLQVLNVNHV